MRYSHKIKACASVKVREEIRPESESLLGLGVKKKLSQVRSKRWPRGVARAWSTVPFSASQDHISDLEYDIFIQMRTISRQS